MAEAVGIVLGVLPLAIEVAKRYKWMYKVFSRYKNCGSEVTEFQRRLHVEQTSFCNEAQILLACLTNFDTANKILAGEDHPLASDSEADEKFARHLGESGIACRGIIEKIKSKLSSIEGFLENSIPGESKQDLIKRTRRKLKFSFAESHLESNLTELGKLNADLVRISGQISRLKHLQVDAVPVVAAQRTKYRVDQYDAVRKAAVQLFEALGKACNIHPEHWAQVQVEPEHVTAANGEPPLIRFIVAFTQSLMTSKTTEVAPVWVVIKSILSNSLADESPEHREEVQHTLSHLKMTLKRVNDSPPPLPAKKLKTNKGVRFVSPEPELNQKAAAEPEQKQQTATCTAMKLASQVLETSLPDFSKDHNLCLQIQQSLAAKREKPQGCIGYLRKGDSCKHRVFSNSNVVATQPSKSTSLAHLIDLVSHRSYAGKLLECESLKLARQLASAVLQFHTTPLMKSSWRSDDVIFFGINESHQRLILMSPHLNVQVRDTTNPSSLSTNTISHRALTGNPYLFGLGIILIELAYQVPFRSLREESDLVNGQEDQTTDFRTAERIAWSIGNGLGKTYGTIVRKCLFCNFGEDTKDLGDLKLQTAFHRDVLCELEKLENQMKHFQLGD